MSSCFFFSNGEDRLRSERQTAPARALIAAALVGGAAPKESEKLQRSLALPVSSAGGHGVSHGHRKKAKDSSG
jgi:hypothetical protein